MNARRLRRLLLLLFALAGLSWAGGCATTDGESDLPWNMPASWEGAPGIPGFENR